MTSTIPPTFLLLLLLMTGCNSAPEVITNPDVQSENARQFYQLKTYSFDTEEQQLLVDEYLSRAYLPALHRQKIGKIGVFKLRQDQENVLLQTFVLLPLESMDQILDLEEKLVADQLYQNEGSTYINAPHDEPPYTRISTVILRSFSEMKHMATPQLDGPRAERIYELRSYESATELDYWTKVDMFNAGGEVTLFDRLGFNAVFYGEVISGAHMPNLMYLTTFSDQESRDEHWKSFFDSPEWKKLLGMPKYENTVSHVDIFYLYPTGYSDY